MTIPAFSWEQVVQKCPKGWILQFCNLCTFANLGHFTTDSSVPNHTFLTEVQYLQMESKIHELADNFKIVNVKLFSTSPHIQKGLGRISQRFVAV